jgi:hypothetical protein
MSDVYGLSAETAGKVLDLIGRRPSGTGAGNRGGGVRQVGYVYLDSWEDGEGTGRASIWDAADGWVEYGTASDNIVYEANDLETVAE